MFSGLNIRLIHTPNVLGLQSLYCDCLSCALASSASFSVVLHL
nr:MAG TPA: hypothetical protein [Caudoviricetes sp.]